MALEPGEEVPPLHPAAHQPQHITRWGNLYYCLADTNWLYWPAKDNIRRKFDSVSAIPESLKGLPGTPDSMLTTEELREEKRQGLERYLNSLLETSLYRENSDVVSPPGALHQEIGFQIEKDPANEFNSLWTETFFSQISFLDVSRLSFLSGSSTRKEGVVRKRHGDYRAVGGCRWVVREQ